MTENRPQLLGNSALFLRMKQVARVVAATDATVLLLGESGTGKKLLARALHADSPRAGKPFVGLTCAGIPESQLESELFGRLGIALEHPGGGRIALGGTLFLDEVGELPLPAQAKLLHFLEAGERASKVPGCVGPADPRVIAASTRDLQAEVERGGFRQDLYYRLNVVPLELPPLRERMDDIPLLMGHFSRFFSREHALRMPRFSAGARKALAHYPWPGNIRELRNLCERLVILFPGQTLETHNLPTEIRRGRPEMADARTDFVLPEAGIDLAELERNIIRQALGLAAGNKSKAARLLGLTRDTLLYRMQKYLIRG